MKRITMTGADTGYAAPNARIRDLAIEAGLCKSEENDQMEPFDITDEDFFM
jgi:hypothetical protein